MPTKLKLNNHTEEELCLLPIPEETNTYTPISHKEIIESIKEQLDKKGFSIRTSNYKSDASGQKLIGLYGIEHSDSELNLMMGFRNSYDKTMSAGIVLGAQVIVCENGMISGDIRVVRKHSGEANIIINTGILESINRFEEEFRTMQTDRDLMKDITLNIQQKAEALGRMYIEKGIISQTQLGAIKNEFSDSKDFRDNTLWSFYNNITESLKSEHPSTYIEKHIKLHHFIKDNMIKA